MIHPRSSFSSLRNECLSALRSLQSSLTKLDLPPVTSKTKISKFCFQKASLIFCTISSSYRLHNVRMEPLKVVVIDEAAQVKESELVIALQIRNLRHAILVGDECQLPGTIKSKLSEKAGFGRSLFERLSSLGHSKHLLNMQYRMHPSISQFPNANFYKKQILDAPNVLSKSYERCYLEGGMFGTYSFINILGGKEEVDDVGHSRRNMVEVAVTLKILQKLFQGWNGSEEKPSIGVISPYAAQVAAIDDELLKQKCGNRHKFTIKVKSVDGFQGGEEDIIIISTARSNESGVIGFLSDPRRVNVALTRARHCLWILGNERTLSKANSVWKALIRDAKHRHCFYTVNDDGDIDKHVITVKKELEQLDDLLNRASVRFKHARWKVTFSDHFRKSFEKLKPSHIKKLVVNVLLKLANGWRPKNIDVDLRCQSSSYVVKQSKVEGYYLLCSIDIVKDSMWTQYLKVWDILWEIPKIWSSSDAVVRYKNLNHDTKCSMNSAIGSSSYAANSGVCESLLSMKFYSLSCAKHLFSDHEGREVELPSEVDLALGQQLF
ncbi:probable helicase MAGATAMA 3 [Henckelia pumila]|uniref:probable helicase MAGATAMA 3 n=1 Tax=Henckelia pumila TaxID=405737 RepID=UPI003C6E0660